ncbi:MAG TPA: SH3 domain-containing protein [Roseiarcus sp.]|nr:SH3 domain-containing protein [Roseiarcus sp.]
MPTTGHVSATSLNLRDGANGDILDVVAYGTAVQVLTDFGDGWPLVRIGDGDAAEVGFVDARFVVWDPPGPQPQPTPVPTPPTPAPQSGGKKYTNSPNEVSVARTTPAIDQTVASLLTAWSDLKQNGARTLTAQYMFETGGGKYCFNWNLGNAKAANPNVLHMYLANVWECYARTEADAVVAQSAGLARIATADEIKTHGWSCPDTVVVFSPPSAQCRFRAFDSLTDGAQFWCGYFKNLAAKEPTFLTTLNTGDVAAVTHALKVANYYSASEAAYAQGVTAEKAIVDKTLGPLK